MLEYKYLKKFIYLLDPERAHNLVEFLSKIASNSPWILSKLKKHFSLHDSSLEQNILGMKFKNPIGLAAGFDKNGTMLKIFDAIGFGFAEFGTITPKPQSGNEKPRVFRFVKENSLQNAMGFNNDGLKKVLSNLEKNYPYPIVIGANIGKNKTTPNEKSLKDYEILINGFKDKSDYIVINISSPNTPNLRDLQNEEFIKSLFQMGTKLTNKPIFLKIAPDLSVKDAINLCEIALEYKASGIIATNTTMDYSLLKNAKNFGGISGEALKQKSFKLFNELAKEFFNKTILISVGGISDGNEAYKRLKAGASLVQIYSALIFKGPSLIKNINQEILTLMKKDGFKNIKEVIGSDRK